MMKKDKLIIGFVVFIMLLAFTIYNNQKIRVSELFAFTGIQDTSQIDPNKYYYVGKRMKQRTITPGKNTEKTCGPEFPDTVYKLADAVDPVCIQEISDDLYTFEATAVPGTLLLPTAPVDQVQP
jgi:hypothetical protein